MSITRRHLTVAGALALSGLGLLRNSSAVAASADEAAVGQAVEALRKATLGQDKTQLEALCADQLSYGHSSGRVENKAQFIDGVMTRKAIVKSITLSDHIITVVGTDAVARHTWASESETDGKPNTPRSASCSSGSSRADTGNCWPARASGRSNRRDGPLRHRWRPKAPGGCALRHGPGLLRRQGTTQCSG